MSTAIVERPKGRPCACHACGLVQGWKNMRCLNPDCGVVFRTPGAKPYRNLGRRGLRAVEWARERFRPNATNGPQKVRSQTFSSIFSKLFLRRRGSR